MVEEANRKKIDLDYEIVINQEFSSHSLWLLVINIS
jgi:hypothetical protein